MAGYFMPLKYSSLPLLGWMIGKRFFSGSLGHRTSLLLDFSLSKNELRSSLVPSQCLPSGFSGRAFGKFFTLPRDQDMTLPFLFIQISRHGRSKGHVSLWLLEFWWPFMLHSEWSILSFSYYNTGPRRMMLLRAPISSHDADLEWSGATVYRLIGPPLRCTGGRWTPMTLACSAQFTSYLYYVIKIVV